MKYFKESNTNVVVTESSGDSYIYDISLINLILTDTCKLYLKIDENFDEFMKNQEEYILKIKESLSKSLNIPLERIEVVSA